MKFKILMQEKCYSNYENTGKNTWQRFFSNWKPQTTVIKQRLTFFQSDQSKAQAYLCTPTKCLVGGNYGTVNSGRLPYYSFITQNRRKIPFGGPHWHTRQFSPKIFIQNNDEDFCHQIRFREASISNNLKTGNSSTREREFGFSKRERKISNLIFLLIYPKIYIIPITNRPK